MATTKQSTNLLTFCKIKPYKLWLVYSDSGWFLVTQDSFFFALVSGNHEGYNKYRKILFLLYYKRIV